MLHECAPRAHNALQNYLDGLNALRPAFYHEDHDA